MKKTLAHLALAFLFAAPAFSQKLISSELKGSKSKAQIGALFGLPIFQYGAKYYKIRYTGSDAAGQLDTLSGLLMVPDDPSKSFPRLVYQHGTADCKTCVPSRYGSAGGAEGQAGLAFAGMGYAVVMPDYVGAGDGRGFHPYMHAATEAQAAVDFLRALPEWEAAHGDAFNEQLFLTGYSQGGHASMALHRALETQLSNEFAVTAAAHLSGPYSVSGVMRGMILADTPYFFPAYVPNILMSYQLMYGNLFADVSDAAQPAYLPLFAQYASGTIGLTKLNDLLVQKLIAETGASVPRRMFQPTYIAAVESDPAGPVNVALRDNDVFRWAPARPTRLFYCMADDQVPFANSLLARDTMKALGAPDVEATDVNSTANHGECVQPAFFQTLLFFNSFQQISVEAAEPSSPLADVRLSPNPADGFFSAENLPDGASVEAFDGLGRVVFSEKISSASSRSISTAGWGSGAFWLKITAKDGRTIARPLLVH